MTQAKKTKKAKKATRPPQVAAAEPPADVVPDEPVEDCQVEDCQVDDGPVGDGPVGDGPVEDDPVEDGPVVDGPVVDGPVEDDPDLVWAVDPDATWWDDVWPFVDETELVPKPTPEPVPEPVDEEGEDPEPEPEDQPEDELEDQPEDEGEDQHEDGGEDRPPDEDDDRPEDGSEDLPEDQYEDPEGEEAHVSFAALFPGAAPDRPGRSRRWLVAVLAAAAAVVVVAGVVWVATRGPSDEQARLTRTDTFAAPVRLAPDTSVVQSRVLASGDLVVTHWIRSRKAVHTVTIRTPHVPGLAPGVVHVGQVVLAANGLLSPSVGQPRGADLVTYRVPAAHRVYVRYQISGAVQRAGPHGRALARITSLDVETGAPLDETTRTVVGARVLSLACSSPAPGAVAVPCGADDRGSWSVRLGRRAGANRVMAQLDLS